MSAELTAPDMITSAAHSPRVVMRVDELLKHFAIRGGLLKREVARVQAVNGISFDLRGGETLGIVGESGCGKSTTARLLMRLIEPDSGKMVFDGRIVGAPGGIPLRQLRRQMQMVFQDSYSSLNPRLPIAQTVAYGPQVHGVPRTEARRTARELLAKVGLDPTRFGERYPHELSGGQRQRVNIARALALDPKVLILDEAVSALDKSVEAQVLNLLVELKRDLTLTFVFISHDLNVVQYISDRVLVMYLGKIVELGDVDAVYDSPAHPYTRALLASRPSLKPGRRTEAAPLTGDPPNPVDPPSGCRFHTRCPFAEEVCRTREPTLMSLHRPGGQLAACHMAHGGSGHSRAGMGMPS